MPTEPQIQKLFGRQDQPTLGIGGNKGWRHTSGNQQKKFLKARKRPATRACCLEHVSQTQRWAQESSRLGVPGGSEHRSCPAIIDICCALGTLQRKQRKPKWARKLLRCPRMTSVSL